MNNLKYIIPLKNNEGLDSDLAYFPQDTKFLAIIDTKKKEIRIIKGSFYNMISRMLGSDDNITLIVSGIFLKEISTMKRVKIKVQIIPDGLKLHEVLKFIQAY